jgi:PBP1b-binding outer membrane lipoprotein LpoB
MNYLRISLAIIASMMLSGCAHYDSSDSTLTQLQIREIQSRDFDTANTKLVMKSIMNVLQDEGYIIKNAVVDLGLINAEKTINVEDTTTAILMVLCANSNARWDKHAILEASANVSEFGSTTRVRINFQTKTLDNYGCPKNVVTIKDPRIYQYFFEKVSKGIFIQEQNI